VAILAVTTLPAFEKKSVIDSTEELKDRPPIKRVGVSMLTFPEFGNLLSFLLLSNLLLLLSLFSNSFLFTNSFLFSTSFLFSFPFLLSFLFLFDFFFLSNFFSSPLSSFC